jgi:hypothetical protein
MKAVIDITKDDLNPYKGVHSEKKQGGAWIVDGRHVADTLQCVHCTGHFVRRPGGGRQFSYCMNCKGFVCDNPDCQGACVPEEMRLEEMEFNRTRNETLKKIDSLPKNILL